MLLRVMLSIFVVAVSGTSLWALTPGDLAGKTLVAKNTKIVLGADGTLSGKLGSDALAGTWTVEGGKMCRVITAPERHAGQSCQAAALANGKLTVTRGDGTKTVYTVK